MTRWRQVWPILLTVLPCCQGNISDECTRACGVLQDCVMLPSVLGTDYDTCRERCDVSDNQVSGVLDCLHGAGKKEHNDSCSADCDRAAVCLQGLTRTDTSEAEQTTTDEVAPLTGVSSIRVIPYLPCGEDECSLASEDCDSSSSQPPSVDESCPVAPNQCDTLLSQEDAMCLCSKLGASTATLQLSHSTGDFSSETRGCVEMLLDTPAFRDVTWGDVEASLFFSPARMAMSSDTSADSTERSDAPQCAVFLGDTTYKARAGGCRAMFVKLDLSGPLTACEQGVDACADQEDNDGDGRTDCDDLKCAAVCDESSSSDATETSSAETSTPQTSGTATSNAATSNAATSNAATSNAATSNAGTSTTQIRTDASVSGVRSGLDAGAENNL